MYTTLVFLVLVFFDIFLFFLVFWKVSWDDEASVNDPDTMLGRVTFLNLYLSYFVAIMAAAMFVLVPTFIFALLNPEPVPPETDILYTVRLLICLSIISYPVFRVGTLAFRLVGFKTKDSALRESIVYFFSISAALFYLLWVGFAANNVNPFDIGYPWWFEVILVSGIVASVLIATTIFGLMRRREV